MNKLFNNALLVLFFLPLIGTSQQDTLEYEKAVQSIIDYQCDLEDLKKDAEYLTTIVGSKLTGSLNLNQASEYILDKAEKLGLDGKVEEIFGAIDYAWKNLDTRIDITSPYYYPINGIPIAWTGSTDGMFESEVVYLKADNVDFLGNPYLSMKKLEENKKLLKGKVLIMHDEVDFETDSSILLNRLNQDYFEVDRLQKSNLTINRLKSMINSMSEREHRFSESLKSVGVKGVIIPSQRNHGIIRGYGSFSGMYKKYDHPLSKIMVSSSDYNRILRLAKTNQLKLEIDINNEFRPDPKVQNTFINIKGSKQSNEVIIIGAHLDSWHLSDGATDNVAGVLILLEAIKILKSLDLELTKSVKLAFWTGEEQGLHGSASWVANNKEQLDKVTAYLNVDTGTGKIRGITSQHNESAIPIFESAFEPLKSIGVIGVKHQYEVGSDYMPFNEAGVPAFHFKQDPIDYYQRTHHTQLDSYEYLRFDEIIQAAKVVAATTFYLANMKETFERI